MNLKARLMTAISMFALVFCVLIVGVWALKSTDFSVGGSINFYAKGIQATISKGVLSSTGSWKTPSDATTKMPEVKINTSKTQDQLDAEFENWTGLSLLFNESGDDVTITFSITNDASYTDKALAVNVTTTSTLENATLAINTNSATILSGKSQEFVITFHVTEKTANAKISAFSINFDLQLVDLVITDESEVSYLTFSYDHDNLTASVTGCADGTETAEIPERVRHTYTSNGQEVTAVYMVTSIGNSAFRWCSRLTSVTIGNGVEAIGDYAFQDCCRLVEIYNKSTMTFTKGSTANGYIAQYAKNIYTPTSGSSKLSTDSNGFIIYTDGTLKSLIHYTGNETEITIPDGTTEINSYAFSGCSILTSITIPGSIVTIGDYAFSTCSGLASVTIVRGVTSIGSSAFDSCSSLTSITIPDSVETIGDYAFAFCDLLETVTMKRTTPPALGFEAFDLFSALTTIYVPSQAAQTAYKKATNWSDYSSKIIVGP